MQWLRKSTFILCALVYLFAMLVTAPASLLDMGLQYATDSRLLLANASGTVWEGAATPALHMHDGHLIVLPPLRWKIALSPIFSGKIRVHLQPNDQALATEAIASFNQIELIHAQFMLPASTLGETSIMLKPLQLRGQLQITGDHLVFSSHGMTGSAFVEWRNASSAISGINELGNYRMALVAAGDRIHIGLTTTSGILLLDGDGNWLAERGLEFHGKAHAAPGSYDALTELLHHLGPEISPGVHSFDFVPQ